MTDKQRQIISELTETEMVGAICLMRRRAAELDWIWEDIEEVADRTYYSDEVRMTVERAFGKDPA